LIVITYNELLNKNIYFINTFINLTDSKINTILLSEVGDQLYKPTKMWVLLIFEESINLIKREENTL